MTESLGILDLLTIRGFDPKCRAKLVRHQDKRFDIPTLIRDGWFDQYQSHQARDIFGDCNYIVSFTGDGGTRAKFLGVYRVLGVRQSRPSDIPRNSPFVEWRDTPCCFYTLEHQPQYADLEGRVVIEWGAGATDMGTTNCLNKSSKTTLHIPWHSGIPFFKFFQSPHKIRRSSGGSLNTKSSWVAVQQALTQTKAAYRGSTKLSKFGPPVRLAPVC